jgi:hypothetical protein
MRWPGNILSVRELRKAYIVLFGKYEGIGSLGRLRLCLEDNIEMDLADVGARFWIVLSRNLLYTIITLQVTYKAENF